MTIDGAITAYSTRLAGSYQQATTPPTVRQLTESVYSRPSAQFQEAFSASKFTPDPAKQVDILV